MSQQHSFVVPAYGQSPYLRDCLRSLRAQTVQSRITVCSSTPFDGLQALCDEFDCELVVNTERKGIGADWNAAMRSAQSELVTIAHQDDIYLPEFAAQVLAAAERHPDSAIYFCDAEEVRSDGSLRVHDRNNRIKRWMVGLAFLGRQHIRGRIAKRMLLGFGNPIVCPAVTVNFRVCPNFCFRQDLRTNMDWLAWVELAQSGGVTHIGRALMRHRVHDDSETARCLDDGARLAEDQMVFGRMWPPIMARVLSRLYSRSYTGYSE